MDLVAKFWNFCHTLRHEGIDYSDYIEELTYLLFLKIAEERNIKIPPGCNWKSLISQEEAQLLKKYNQILTKLSKQESILGDIFRHPIAKIRNVSSLKKLLTLIDEEDWSSYNSDILGNMFEGLLEKAASESKKGAGQYFTPRPLIETIVKVMKPDPFESAKFRVSDIACGTAGFLISSFEWFKKSNNINKLAEPKRKKLFERTYFGQELVVRPRRMAQMNLYLHGISPNIILGDTIYEPLTDERYTCILTNPPFGTKGANQIPKRSDFPIKTSNKQLNFIQHVFNVLEKNGRAAIVVPDSVLFDDKSMELWKHYLPLVNLHTILKLPNGTFLPYANVKANVFFLQNGYPTKNIWIYDARTNVGTVTKKDRPLTDKYFNEFEKNYGKSPNGDSPRKETGKNGRFQKVPMQIIEQRNFNLDISWLDTKIPESRHLRLIEPQALASEAIGELELAIGQLKDIINFLDVNEKR
jgi:type I restriction enzyme M protein